MSFFNLFFSGGAAASIESINNEYELVVCASKDLERLLKETFPGAIEGKGLHELLNDVIVKHLMPVTQVLTNDIRYVATIRNKLVHESDFDKSKLDRGAFIRHYLSAKRIITEEQKRRETKASPPSSNCIIC